MGAEAPDAPAGALTAVRLATSGAAPLPRAVALAVRRRFGVEVAEGYGLTEASPVVTSGADAGTPLGSVGRPLPGVEVRLVDPFGDDVLVGDPGEVWVRGANVFAGYWADDEATSAVLTPDGWLRTGDVGVADDSGNLWLVDRLKDLVLVSGFNVYPAEVEDVLARHPAVAAVAVVGVPDERSGEALVAHVVPRPGATVDPDDLRAHAAARLAPYKVPAEVRPARQLPVGLAGKLRRRVLRGAPPG